MKSKYSGFIFIELTKGEDRTIDGIDIADTWRNKLPPLLGIKTLTIYLIIVN